MLVNVWKKNNQKRARNVVLHHVPNGLLVNGPNVPRFVVVEHSHEVWLVRIVMLVNVQRKINQRRPRNVVKYHVPNGMLEVGVSVPRHVMVEHNHEVWLVRTMMLVNVWEKNNQRRPRNVVLHFVLNGLLVNGPNVPRRVVVEHNQEAWLVRIVMLVNVQRKINQIRSRNVVKYHVRNGLLEVGVSVPSLAVVEHNHELWVVRIVILVDVWRRTSPTKPKSVVNFHVLNGLWVNGVIVPRRVELEKEVERCFVLVVRILRAMEWSQSLLHPATMVPVQYGSLASGRNVLEEGECVILIKANKASLKLKKY